MQSKKYSRFIFVPLLLSILCIFPAFKKPGNSFIENQLKNERVAIAKAEKDAVLKKLCAENGISYPVKNIFIRVFKKEAQLEVWVSDNTNSKYKLLKTYPICVVSGQLGPKRREGDGQTPEGFYTISNFNPQSSFYLSLGVNYPNASDRIKSDKKHPGGDIYIHGNCVSIGCMPIKDDGIKELYWLGIQAKAVGQKKISVHIFPFRMTKENISWAQKKFGEKNYQLIKFWHNMDPGYTYFEKNKSIPKVSVDKKGWYVIRG